ncbi:Spo0B domain-containing protein [Virgibacillus kekensis]|uniref:Spo0B domain-containing protein n=1 Tax=Virgibacillus kekensis TaxID=202261 RepID=A0ABV9DN06_9BACI
MDENEIISILRHYRHDLLNQLQIIQGYVSMGKTDKANMKIREYVQDLHEERKLANLDIPKFALYLIRFNSLHTNFRMTYHIYTENSELSRVEERMLEQCRQFIGEIENAADEAVLYDITLEMNDTDSSSVVDLNFNITGNFPSETRLISNIENMGLDIIASWNEEALVCSLKVPNQ